MPSDRDLPPVPVALTVAGSDPGGGAGVQADLKTFSALGVYGASVITVLTAQNTLGVHALHEPPASFLAAQLDAVLDDLEPRAVKLGLVPSAAAAATLARILEARNAAPLVADPVLVSSRGDELVDRAGLDAWRTRLVPLATVLTPNLPEAARLLGRSVQAVGADRAAACRDLRGLGARCVLLKGGHAPGARAVDVFDDGSGPQELDAPRLATANTHGTGCTLSAALAAGLARGQEPSEAVRRAKAYTHGALAAADGLRAGRGPGPLHHLHELWRRAGLR